MFKKLGIISKEAKARDKKVGNAIRKQQRRGKGLIKILLLGSGESGKTTGKQKHKHHEHIWALLEASNFGANFGCLVFKQMCMLQGQGFTEMYFKAMKSKLCGNVVDGTWNVIKYVIGLVGMHRIWFCHLCVVGVRRGLERRSEMK